MHADWGHVGQLGLELVELGQELGQELAEARAVSAFVDTRGRVAHVKAINWKMCK